MLTVETFVAPSPVHGMGLFAKTPIEAGTLVSYYEAVLDRILTPKDLINTPQIARAFFRDYAFCIGDDYLLFSDNGRFINHHEVGNLGYLEFGRNPTRAYFHAFIALVEIPSGAELTTNYSTFAKEQYEQITSFKELHDAQAWPPKVSKS